MIVTSNGYKDAIKKNRIFYADIQITTEKGEKISVTKENLFSLSITDNVSSANSFDVGSAISNQVTIKLDNSKGIYDQYDFADAQILVKIGLRLADGTTEWLNKGLFTSDPGEDTGAALTLKAYDNMLKFDRSYSNSSLTYPASLGAIVRDACSRCEVPLGTPTFDMDDFVVQQRPEDEALTFREVLCWVGQLSCHWFRCNTAGQLEAGWYDTDGYENDTGKFFEVKNITSQNISEDVVITGVKIKQKSGAEYLVGNKGYVLEITENELLQDADIQTVGSLLGEKLIGLRFRKLSVTHQSDPSMEAGDLAKVTTRNATYKTLITGTTFQLGAGQQSECAAETPIRKSADRFSKSTQNYVSLRKLIKQEKTDRELAIENLNKVLENSSGLYPTYEEQPDGSTITYFHDKPTLAESKNVIKITADAVGVSNDGGKTYPFGFFLTGTMITKLLYAEGINADYIDAGSITVKDQQEKIIFQADFATGKVTISGDCVMIGDKTATDAIKDAMDAATAAASNMTMQLDNDHATVPVDADGKYEKFPEGITTRPIVMYGSKDVTDQCSFSITESTAISGAWDSETRTYVATALEADTAWVDIKATYLGTLSVSKRFTVSKLHAGVVGPPGRVYSLEMSVSIVKIGKDNVYNPDAISAAAYFREDTNARQAYNGRFRIRETADGYTWSTIYESTQDESSIEHYLYTLFRTTDGKLIQASNGSYLAMPRAISEIEVSLFSAGDAGELIDIKRVSVLKEVAALTQEEIFNILTNDGAAKGIYKIGKELYVNATYMRAGVLADLLGRNRWNLETGEFRLSGMATVDGKLIADKEAVAATEKALKEAIEKVNNSVTDVEKQINMENVFNLWFQNGKTKGFLLDSNGDLYVSFSYARGGTLKLGGVNNGNGLLSILDANGSQVGYIDNTGVNFKKGTFSGQLSAATGTFSGTLSAAKGTFAGDVSAATGTFKGAIESKTSDGKSSVRLNGAHVYFNTQIGPAASDYNKQYAYIRPEEYKVVQVDEILTEITYPSLVMRSNYDLKLNCNGTNVLHARHNATPKLSLSSFTTSGQKSRVVEGTQYGDRLLYCYETPTPMFADIGGGQLNEDGFAVVALDPVFMQTVNTSAEYRVFLQKEGKGDIWIEAKEPAFFTVKGTPGLIFAWEVKCIQKGFETLRLEDYGLAKNVGGQLTETEIKTERLIGKSIYAFDQETSVLIGQTIREREEESKQLISVTITHQENEMEELIYESIKNAEHYEPEW